MPTLTRSDLRALALTRIREANALRLRGYYDGAYYLCGYAVECALKACIAKNTRRYDFPDKRTVDQSWTHDLDRLLGVSGLRQELEEDWRIHQELEANWTTIKDWNEGSRYGRHSRQEAEALYSAVSDDQHGVLPWLRQRW